MLHISFATLCFLIGSGSVVGFVIGAAMFVSMGPRPRDRDGWMDE
jgi:hypothetical protein